MCEREAGYAHQAHTPMGRPQCADRTPPPRCPRLRCRQRDASWRLCSKRLKASRRPVPSRTNRAAAGPGGCVFCLQVRGYRCSLLLFIVGLQLSNVTAIIQSTQTADYTLLARQADTPEGTLPWGGDSCHELARFRTRFYSCTKLGNPNLSG